MGKYTETQKKILRHLVLHKVFSACVEVKRGRTSGTREMKAANQLVAMGVLEMVYEHDYREYKNGYGARYYEKSFRLIKA